MRVVVIFFLSLFLLLSGGYARTHTDLYQSKISYSTNQNTSKAQFTNTSKDFTVSKSTNNDEEKEYFIIVENEEDHVFSRKYILLVKYFSTLSFAFDLSYSYSFFKDNLPFCTHLSYSSSYKYITQRVLRI